MQINSNILYKLKSSVPFFSHFSDEELLTLLKNSKKEVYNKTSEIFRENSVGDSMYIIVAGLVMLTQRIGGEKRKIIELREGSCFGEMGLIDDLPRSATATACSETVETLAISEGVLQQNNLKILYKLYRGFFPHSFAKAEGKQPKIQPSRHQRKEHDRQTQANSQKDDRKRRRQLGGNQPFGLQPFGHFFQQNQPCQRDFHRIFFQRIKNQAIRFFGFEFHFRQVRRLRPPKLRFFQYQLYCQQVSKGDLQRMPIRRSQHEISGIRRSQNGPRKRRLMPNFIGFGTSLAMTGSRFSEGSAAGVLFFASLVLLVACSSSEAGLPEPPSPVKNEWEIQAGQARSFVKKSRAYHRAYLASKNPIGLYNAVNQSERALEIYLALQKKHPRGSELSYQIQRERQKHCKFHAELLRLADDQLLEIPPPLPPFLFLYFPLGRVNLKSVEKRLIRHGFRLETTADFSDRQKRLGKLPQYRRTTLRKNRNRTERRPIGPAKKNAGRGKTGAGERKARLSVRQIGPD